MGSRHGPPGAVAHRFMTTGVQNLMLFVGFLNTNRQRFLPSFDVVGGSPAYDVPRLRGLAGTTAGSFPVPRAAGSARRSGEAAEVSRGPQLFRQPPPLHRSPEHCQRRGQCCLQIKLHLFPPLLFFCITTSYFD